MSVRGVQGPVAAGTPEYYVLKEQTAVDLGADGVVSGSSLHEGVKPG